MFSCRKPGSPFPMAVAARKCWPDSLKRMIEKACLDLRTEFHLIEGQRTYIRLWYGVNRYFTLIVPMCTPLFNALRLLKGNCGNFSFTGIFAPGFIEFDLTRSGFNVVYRIHDAYYRIWCCWELSCRIIKPSVYHFESSKTIRFTVWPGAYCTALFAKVSHKKLAQITSVVQWFLPSDLYYHGIHKHWFIRRCYLTNIRGHWASRLGA